jgi:mannose-1-phosphate guanylyltransferase
MSEKSGMATFCAHSSEVDQAEVEAFQGSWAVPGAGNWDDLSKWRAIMGQISDVKRKT